MQYAGLEVITYTLTLLLARMGMKGCVCCLYS